MQNTTYQPTEINQRTNRLTELREEMETLAIQGNLPLVSLAHEIVPGEGNPMAEIMFIGEAAGRNELEQRRPFVGVAGRLLNRRLEAIGVRREDVYISNVVKTRPPNNRDPLPAEIQAYRAFLDAEIEIIDPKLIVTLGRFSMGKFLPEVKIGQVHGRVFQVEFNGKARFVMPLYHPAAALRRKLFLETFIQEFGRIPKVLAYVKEKHQELEMQESIQELVMSHN